MLLGTVIALLLLFIISCIKAYPKTPTETYPKGGKNDD